ncbi:MAG: ABC transporter permease, partial [Ruminococcaceae bacterium]|nr:ABC transporter permease [Oscillospiraceae bacterium]
RIRKNKIAFFSLMLIALYVLLAIFAPMFSQYGHAEISAELRNATPSAAHWLGCDHLGRDIWVRIWMGARVSLTIGLAAAVINLCIGALIGGISGYYGGKLDMFIMRLIDVLYGIPSLIITILVMVALNKTGMITLIIAMVIVGWIGVARMARGQVLQLKEQDFVAAAKVMGVPDFQIIVKHLLPNLIGYFITSMTMAIPGAIFQEAFLSYIGLGITPPDCSWGVIAKEGIAMMRVAPHEVIVPAFFICTTMLAFNLLGDGLRDAFDPKLRGTE